MCDERERLLDYVYDECDAAERRRVDQHLEACDACREEISSLRAVRLNLLAWNVPEHGSVWEPFAPARTTPWWREVPVWALSAAASVMFLLGLGGGLASRQLMLAHATVAPPAQTSGVSQADLAAMEQRLLGAVQVKLAQQAPAVAPARVQEVNADMSHQQLMKEVRSLISTSEEKNQEALANTLNAWIADSRTFARADDVKAQKNDLLKIGYAVSQNQGGR